LSNRDGARCSLYSDLVVIAIFHVLCRLQELGPRHTAVAGIARNVPALEPIEKPARPREPWLTRLSQRIYLQHCVPAVLLTNQHPVEYRASR
jgi:hypothetical protein